MTDPTHQAPLEKPNIWRFSFDAIDFYYYQTRVSHYHPETRLLNTDYYVEQRHLHAKRYGMMTTVPLVLPDDLPPMLLNYPMQGSILPDLLHPWRLHLCSARLRDAMALPPGVVQYLPVDIRALDPRVHAMDYKALHILAYQPVIDLKRSDVTIELKPDRHTGGIYPWFSFDKRWAIRAGFQPQTDLFCSAEDVHEVFVTDALAERVMRAGCLGCVFKHPEGPNYSGGLPQTIRTARGIELAGPKARRAHLRRVKRARAQQPANAHG